MRKCGGWSSLRVTLKILGTVTLATQGPIITMEGREATYRAPTKVKLGGHQDAVTSNTSTKVQPWFGHHNKRKALSGCTAFTEMQDREERHAWTENGGPTIFFTSLPCPPSTWFPLKCWTRIFAIPRAPSVENIKGYRILGVWEEINALVRISGCSRGIDLL